MTKETSDTSLSDMSFLIVDDEAMSRSVLVRLLEKRGAGFIETANNGEEALEALAAMDQPPDILFVDIHMPVLSGPELLHELASQDYEGAITVVSGMEPETLDVAEQLARMRGLNISGVMTKPVTDQSMADNLADIFEGG